MKDNSHVIITPCKHKMEALLEFPELTDRTQLRHFLGMINQIGAWIKDFQLNIKNLNEMTSEKSLFLWRPIHTDEFQTWKKMLSNHIDLTSFDSSIDTFLQCD